LSSDPLVIWDIDGTLADTEAAIEAAMAKADSWLVEQAARPVDGTAWATLRQLSHGNITALCELVACEAGVSESGRAVLREIYKAALLDAITPQRDAISVLRAVVRYGGVNAVSSTGDESYQKAKIRQIGAGDYIDESLICVYPAGDVRGKPGGAPIARIRGLSNSVTDSIWVIGDGWDDIASASAAGVRSIYLTDAPECSGGKLTVLTPTHATSRLTDVVDIIGLVGR
jgi:phosphoglycolate phosphatase-like HAD superfamily hydrolase